jgi:hypothetical protein
MSLKIAKLHPMFCGDVANVDLSKPIDQASLEGIEAALDEYAVLISTAPSYRKKPRLPLPSARAARESERCAGD